MESFEQEAEFDATPADKGSIKKPVPPVKPVPAPVPVPGVAPAVTSPTTLIKPETPTPAVSPIVAVPAVPGATATGTPAKPEPAKTALGAPVAAPKTEPVPATTVAPVPPVPLQRGLLQIAAPSSVTVGQQFSVEVKVSGVSNLASAFFELTFDPVFVEYVSITEGAFLHKDGKPTSFSGKPDASSGTVAVSLARTAANEGVSGAGTMVTALFKAKKQGPASFAFRNSTFTSLSGSAVPILPFSTAVDIR
jgi:hypothetical protein